MHAPRDHRRPTTCLRRPRVARGPSLLEAKTHSEASAGGPRSARVSGDERVGPYRIGPALGSGGMATVHLGTHARTGQEVAVKRMAPGLDDNEALVARFRQEARALFAIEHPAVVRIFDLLETSEGPVLIMERVRGRPLSGLLAERGALPRAHAFAVASALADALRAVHARGVIHRDIKPDNVLVLDGYDPDGAAPPRVKLVDFGIAKLPDGACEHRTIPGVTMGTPAYMAPEQIGGGPTSPATDVFALAALLVEMLSGARAFAGDTQWVLRQKLSGAVPKLALPRESAGLRRLLLGGLQHDPRLRPDLDTFARALEGDAQAPRWWLPAILTAAMLAGAILGWSASETPAHAARPVASAAR